jgi:Zn-dependent protease with chaperone function
MNAPVQSVPELPKPLRGTLFDAHSAQGTAVDVLLFGDQLILEPTDVSDGGRRVSTAARKAHLREVFSHTTLAIDLPGGAVCEIQTPLDGAAVRTLRSKLEAPPGIATRLTRSNTGLTAVGLAFAAFLALTYFVLIPQLAVVFVTWMPPKYAEKLDSAIYTAIAKQYLNPSRLNSSVQTELLARAEQLTVPAPLRDIPRPLQIKIRHAPALGPNAFALPGGTIVVTDQLIRLAPSTDAVLGVIAHEMGHVSHQHGLQNIAKSTALGLFFAVYMGDFSAVGAAAGALITQTKYSRDAERQADEYALAVLRANGIAPAAMAAMFRALMEKERESDPLPEFLLTHPANEDRVKRFEDAR